MKDQPLREGKVKAVFFDIDGTLLSHRTGRVPSSAECTLMRLHEKGIRLFLSTGRHFQEISDVDGLLDFPWDGYITLNGQYCSNGSVPYYAQPIEKQDISGLITCTDKLGIPCMFVEENDLYVSKNTEVVRKVQQAIHSPLHREDDLKRGLLNPVYLAVIYCTMEEQNRLLSHLSSVKATCWNPYAFDIIHKDGSKENGIRKTCEKFGISMKETMAFGDGENDIGMLQCVAYGFAMGNASEEVKKSARYITADIDEDGIALAMEKMGL